MNNSNEHKRMVNDHSPLPSPTIHEIISKQANEELGRSNSALAWSALVAGICISFSLICEGILRNYLPDEKQYFLIENLGYTAGFLIVILGRFQLFTENTITVVLPVLKKFSYSSLLSMLRLWGVVLLFNILGAFIISFLIYYTPIFDDALKTVFLDISHHAVVKDYQDVFIQAIPAGFLIAALVWITPNAEQAQFWLIIFMTYLIAVGGFAHIIAGSVEAFLLIFDGQITSFYGVQYIVMAGLGNIVGGTFLFAVMAHEQVKEEI